jgi:putative phosphoesterase
MQIAIIADTHLPKSNRRLPDLCVERLREADLIVHAGDFSELSVLREVQSYGQLIAVHGNADAPDVRAELPRSCHIDADGASIAVVHNGGPASGRIERLHHRFPDADAVIFGHSHIPLHETAPDGFQIFNPGSPTERRKAPRHTMGIATVDGGKLSFELIALD